MDTVRTTISFDPALHQQLSLQAVKMGLGLSELVNLKLVNENFGQTTNKTVSKIAGDLAFFKLLAKKVGKSDWVKIIREERDRDRG